MSPQETLDAFVGLSVVLTGFAEADLANPAVNLHRMYLARAQDEKPDVLAELLAEYAALKAKKKSDEEIGEAILDPARTDLSHLARTITAMWYLASWYDDPEHPMSGSEVVNMEAYTNGLVWKTIGAPASGMSRNSYGYWAAPPPGMKE